MQGGYNLAICISVQVLKSLPWPKVTSQMTGIWSSWAQMFLERWAYETVLAAGRASRAGKVQSVPGWGGRAAPAQGRQRRALERSWHQAVILDISHSQLWGCWAKPAQGGMVPYADVICCGPFWLPTKELQDIQNIHCILPRQTLGRVAADASVCSAQLGREESKGVKWRKPGILSGSCYQWIDTQEGAGFCFLSMMFPVTAEISEQRQTLLHTAA